MTQKLWLKKLKLNYSKNVFDVIQFGSSVKEGKEPNDIDIAIIFNTIPIKNQLDEAQEIKRQLEKISDLPIHIKSFDLYSFFNPANFAKEDILFHGKSLIYQDYFARRFGLIPKIQISYSLKKLKKSEKIKVNYMLNGKQGSYGLLRKHEGKLIRPGMIEINPEYKEIFLESLKKLTNEVSSKEILSR